MDIKDLNKTQLILLTLLITFVVSIATGIVTVSLMQQVPMSVPQTINNVIQRTIEKVNTVQVPSDSNKGIVAVGENQKTLVDIYPASMVEFEKKTASEIAVGESLKSLGQGVIVSDAGLILTESSFLFDNQEFAVLLNGKYFRAQLLKKFNNGFSVIFIVSNAKKIPDDEKNPSVDIQQ